jgi:transcriptional regulator with XRE-family HTH domain
MKLGTVLKKERERRAITPEHAAQQLGLNREVYSRFEEGGSPMEEWAPKLAELAIKLSTPTSRLISRSGKSAQIEPCSPCGRLVELQREKNGLSRDELARKLGWTVEQLAQVEGGTSPIEEFGPLMLRFAEMVEQPIFNLFYPCGLPLNELTDYP